MTSFSYCFRFDEGVIPMSDITFNQFFPGRFQNVVEVPGGRFKFEIRDLNGEIPFKTLQLIIAFYGRITGTCNDSQRASSAYDFIADVAKDVDNFEKFREGAETLREKTLIEEIKVYDALNKNKQKK